MQFQVPQFIDVEDKLFGPLTFKQFLYVAGGGAISFLIYKLLPSLIAWPLMIFFGGMGAALAFYKVNDRPFIFTLQAWINYQLASKLYIWKREDKAVKKEEDLELGRLQQIAVPKVSRSKLKDLAWSLDIQENVRK